MLPSIRQLHSSARSDFPKDFVAPTSQSAIAARRIALAGLRRRLAVAKLSITPNEEDAAPSERRRRANPHRRHELTIAAARRLAFELPVFSKKGSANEGACGRAAPSSSCRGRRIEVPVFTDQCWCVLC
jgi:hypothetical protein